MGKILRGLNRYFQRTETCTKLASIYDENPHTITPALRLILYFVKIVKAAVPIWCTECTISFWESWSSCLFFFLLRYVGISGRMNWSYSRLSPSNLHKSPVHFVYQRIATGGYRPPQREIRDDATVVWYANHCLDDSGRYGNISWGTKMSKIRKWTEITLRVSSRAQVFAQLKSTFSSRISRTWAGFLSPGANHLRCASVGYT